MGTKIPEKYLNLFSDFGFKKILGQENNPGILIDFLNSVLQLEKKIIEIGYLNNEQLGIREPDRKAVFDVHCKDEEGNIFTIEVQRLKEENFKSRSVYYSTFPIVSQAKRGDWNFGLKKMCTVCVMDFCFEDTAPEYMVHEVKLIETNTYKVFIDNLMFCYIEMPKFKKQEQELITRRDKWFYIINNLHKLKEIPVSLSGDPIFKQIFMDAETAKLMEAELFAYVASRKAEWDEYAIRETAKKDGFKQGHEQGHVQGREQGLLHATSAIAHLMKSKNEPWEKIVEYTGLSTEEIERL